MAYLKLIRISVSVLFLVLARILPLDVQGMMCYQCGNEEDGSCINGENGVSKDCGPLKATCIKYSSENGSIEFRGCDYTDYTVGCEDMGDTAGTSEICYCNIDNCNSGPINDTTGGGYTTQPNKSNSDHINSIGLVCHHCGPEASVRCVDGENGPSKECGPKNATCAKDIYENGTVYSRYCSYIPISIGCHFLSKTAEVCYCASDNCNGGSPIKNIAYDLMCYQCGGEVNVSCNGGNGTSKQCGPMNATCWKLADDSGTVIARDCNYTSNIIGCRNRLGTTAQDCYCDTHHCNGEGSTNATKDTTVLKGLSCYHCGFGNYPTCTDTQNGEIKECGTLNANCKKIIARDGTVFRRECDYWPNSIGCKSYPNSEARECFCNKDLCNRGGRNGGGLTCYHCGVGFGASVDCIDGQNGLSKECGPENATCWKFANENGVIIARDCNYMSNSIGCSYNPYTRSEDCYCNTDLCNVGSGTNVNNGAIANSGPDVTNRITGISSTAAGA